MEPDPSVRRVALFVTCVVDVLEPDVAAACVQVLRAGGCAVSVPDGQTCCGQPAWNAGFADDAARVARTSLDALEAADDAVAVAVPAGSCATMIRVFWPELFALVGDAESARRAEALAPRVRELSELAAGLSLPLRPAPEPEPVAYHHSCHALRELRIHDEPLELLDRCGVAVRPWEADERCCGFGGTFSVKLPETSVAMADDKLDSLAEAGATEVVGIDSSCLMQLRCRAEATGRTLRTRHLAQVLAERLDEPGVAPPREPGAP